MDLGQDFDFSRVNVGVIKSCTELYHIDAIVRT